MTERQEYLITMTPTYSVVVSLKYKVIEVKDNIVAVYVNAIYNESESAFSMNTTKVTKNDDQQLIHKKCFSEIRRELKDWIKFIDSKNRK